jgi:hypothetical protein
LVPLLFVLCVHCHCCTTGSAERAEVQDATPALDRSIDQFVAGLLARRSCGMAWIAQQPRLISRWELAMQAGDQPCSRAPLCAYRSETQMLLPSLGQRELSISSAAQHHVALRKLIWNGHLGRLALDLLSHSRGKKSSHHQVVQHFQGGF